MIVLDASAAVEFLVARDARGDWAAGEILGAGELCAPHLVDTEVVSGLRRLLLNGRIRPEAAAGAVRSWSQLRIRRFTAAPLLERIWMLRDSLTASDATYVALAEALELPLVTTDQRLARAGGHGAVVTAFPG